LISYCFIYHYIGFVLKTQPKSKHFKERYNKLNYQQSESNMLTGENN